MKKRSKFYIGFFITSLICSLFLVRDFTYLIDSKEEVIILLNDNKNKSNLISEFNKFKIDYEIKEEIKGIGDYFIVDINESNLTYLDSFKSINEYSLNKAYEFKEDKTYASSTYFTPLENDSIAAMNIDSNTQNRGENTIISVLDTSFTLEHNSFTDLSSDISLRLTKDEVVELVNNSKLNASSLTSYYYNNKFPFYHDYGGTIVESPLSKDGYVVSKEDSDVFTNISNHGMHVSSIASANNLFTGIAPSSQLLFMKVSGETSSNSESLILDSSVLKALNDSYLLGADIINMSFGTDLSEFNFGNVFYETLKKLNESGVIVCVANGNSGRGYFKETGIYEYSAISYIDNSAIGEYSDSEDVVSVGSSNLILDSSLYSTLYTDEFIIPGIDELVYNKSNSMYNYLSKDYRFSTLLNENETSRKFQYEVIPNYGSSEDYLNIDVTDKIAVVKLKETSITNKIKIAKNNGAIGIIVCNSSDEDSLNLNFNSLKDKDAIPTYKVSSTMYDKLSNLTNKYIYVSKDMESYYSTEGNTSDLRLKLDVLAPGNNIAGAVNVSSYTSSSREYTNAYEYMSGTSMASPNACGAFSYLLGSKEFETEEERTEYKKNLKNIVVNSADIIIDTENSLPSVRKQGGGILNAQKALNTSLYLVNEDNKAKIELKNNIDIKNGDISFNVTINNLDGIKGNYKLNLLVSIPYLINVNDTVYSSSLEGNLMTLKNEILDNYEKSIYLDGSKTQTISISYSLKSEHKEYINTYFKEGTYVEGYLSLLNNEEENIASIPYMGFYGDLEEIGAVEPFDFELDLDSIYESNLANEYVSSLTNTNVNYSSLMGVYNSIKTSQINNIMTSIASPYDYFDKINYEKINDEYYIYAGRDDVSDNIYVQQFVNRSVKTNSIQILDSNNNLALEDHMYSLFYGEENDYKLYKSIITPSLYSSGYYLDRAYTLLDLSSLKDGTYTLKFSYELLDGTLYEKEYGLIIVNEDISSSISLNDISIDNSYLNILLDKNVVNLTYNDLTFDYIYINDKKKFKLDLNALPSSFLVNISTSCYTNLYLYVDTINEVYILLNNDLINYKYSLSELDSSSEDAKTYRYSFNLDNLTNSSYNISIKLINNNYTSFSLYELNSNDELVSLNYSLYGDYINFNSSGDDIVIVYNFNNNSYVPLNIASSFDYKIIIYIFIFLVFTLGIIFGSIYIIKRNKK